MVKKKKLPAPSFGVPENGIAGPISGLRGSPSDSRGRSCQLPVKRMAQVLLLLLAAGHWQLGTAWAQQAQAQQGQPLYAVNAKYVNGVAPGYWPTAGAGLTLNIAAGTAICGNLPVKVDYAGGTLTMTNAATNYVYLDPVASCVPAKNTMGFTAGVIPVAQVAAAGGVITGVTDVRTWFVDPNSYGPVCRADLMPGADAGAKIAACWAAMPTGGTTDARGLEGPQTIAQNVFAGVTKPVRLLLGAASVASPYTITVGQVITVGGTTIEGLGRHITNLTYTPAAGTAITVTVPLAATDRTNPKLAGFSLYGTGKAVGAVTGIAITDGVGFRLSDLYLNGFSVDGLAVTGDVALGTNTNMGSADGVFVRDAGANGIRIEGNNANVLHFINMDVRGCPVGVYFKRSGNYPAENFFHGHVSYNTTNLLIESMFNQFKVYLENSALTTWHIDLTVNAGYNTIEVLTSPDALKYRDLGTLNSIRRNYALWQAFPTDPAADSAGGSFGVYPTAVAGPNARTVQGVSGNVTLRANNTQDWTGTYGLIGSFGLVNIQAGAVGIVTNVALFRGYSDIAAGTVTNWYGVYIPAPTGAGTVINKWSFKSASGAGIAEIADGIKTAKFVISGVNIVTFSATPTFNASLGNTQKITLTGNVTSSTLSNATTGQTINFLICQDATGGRTFVWPTNVKGGMTIGSTLSTCSAQDFIFDGTNAYAVGPGVTNM